MTGYSFELTHPLRLLGLAVLPLLAWYFYKSLVDLPRWQRGWSLGIRSLIVLLLVLALAGLTWLHPTHEPFVVFVVDQSVSVGDEGRKGADEFLTAALKEVGNKPFHLIPFAAQPELPTKEVTKKESGVRGQEPGAASPPGTNLEAALEAAVASLPPGYVPQVVLLSDGNQTQGDALRAALRAGMPISTVPLATRKDPEAQVSSVGLPAQVRQGEPFYVEVVIDSNHDDEGLIQVYRGDHQVVSERKTIKKGENRFRFQQSIQTERLASFSARVSGLKEDTLLDNNAESGLVYAAGKPRVLIVESDPKLIRELVMALEQEEIQVDVRPPQGMPDNLADLQNYELLVLSNVPATDLSQKQMEVARTYVQELGGGFMMLGGEQSFGLGGYYKTVLEEILPVRSDFEKEKEKPSLAMALVIDKSGSMDGDKIEMAKSAARSAAELLSNTDQVAVIAFDGDTYVVSEMQSAGNKGRISDDISRIESGGGTTMYPALEQAYEMLQSTVAKLKHVIVLTDGVSSPGDFAGLAQAMAQDRITVSTVAMGADSDTALLEEIAKTGQGRYYFADDPANVPQIFAKETVTASKSAIDEQPFVPQVVRASQALKEIDLESAPFLLGYVMTRPKPTCEVILATEKGDPLLVWWRYGLGMTVAFTSDAKSRWAAEWLTWPGYGKFWAQVARHTMRKSDAKGVAVEIASRGGIATVSLDSVDPSGRFLNQAETEMTLIDPLLASRKVSLVQTAPGRYTASFRTDKSGAYHLELTQKQNGQVVYRQSRGLSVGYSDELRLRPTNEPLLKSIAEASGGKYQMAAGEVFAPQTRTALRPTPLWPWLVTAAALLLVLDVFLRRIDLNLLLGRRPAAAWAPAKSAAKPRGGSRRRTKTPVGL
ncbi:MAG TPA: VWA domain-containing protein [Pirellulaceae bacterium]|nr:VWA domain-containing protein [Pirellulaceae bacterium]